MRRAVPWLAVGVWAVLIFALSAQPNLRSESDELLDLLVRKIGHMGVFGVLALLLHARRPAGDSRRVVSDARPGRRTSGRQEVRPVSAEGTDPRVG